MTRRHRVSRALALLSACLCVFAAGGATAAGAAVDSLERLRGAYVFSGGASEIEAMDRAIDRAVSDMSFLIRGIAKKRLREPNLPSEELRIVVEGDSIQVMRTGQPTIAAPASGESVEWRNPDNGNTLRVRHRVVGANTLEQRLRGDRGLSVNRFVLEEGGSRLAVQTVITADKLPEPLRFSTTYARRGPSERR